jgi:histidine triad (HIT) family protein
MVDDCVFCEMIERDTNTRMIREFLVCAFPPLDPIAPGHMLVAPMFHVPDIFGAAPHLQADMILMTRQIADAQRDALGATGVNILNASGEGSQQSVMHLHFHVIPRWPDDGISTWPGGTSRHVVNGGVSHPLAYALTGIR